jgi:hypothetical protein
MPYTEAKHFLNADQHVLFDVGIFYRLRLGLSVREVAKVVQVCFHLAPGGVTSYFQAISGDPDEQLNLNEFTMLNDQNLLAYRAASLLGVVANGPLMVDTLVIPIPNGIDVAGDVMYSIGVLLSAVNTLHGCSVYYERRKAKPGEREAIIMAQR